ncbi:MAG: hypothetical protein J0M16_02430, partial [Gammaproteobacteria bacterium]|nr:hypothetical protein [Gammaproteobacteria bacterium]
RLRSARIAEAALVVLLVVAFPYQVIGEQARVPRGKVNRDLLEILAREPGGLPEGACVRLRTRREDSWLPKEIGMLRFATTGVLAVPYPGVFLEVPVEPGKPRLLLLRADLAADGGSARQAVEQLAQLGPDDPAIRDAVVARLLAWHALPGFREEAARQLAVIGRTAPGLRGIALATLRDNRRDDPLALGYLTDFIGRQPVLSALLPPGERGNGDLASLDRVRPLLNRMLKSGTRFQCGNCGYESIASQWQCPGCRSWDSVRPVTSDLLKEILG